MFWENLKDDGQVVKAITEYVKNGRNSNTNQQNQNTNNNNTNTTKP
jgi:23S rRNA maturation mini-RNase III